MYNSYVLSTAWNIIKKNRHLWIFGLMAGLLAGSGQKTLNNVFVQGGAWVIQNLSGLAAEAHTSAIMIAIISLAFWPIGALARIALVSKVSELSKRRGKPTGKMHKAIQQQSHLYPGIYCRQPAKRSIELGVGDAPVGNFHDGFFYA